MNLPLYHCLNTALPGVPSLPFPSAHTIGVNASIFSGIYDVADLAKIVGLSGAADLCVIDAEVFEPEQSTTMSLEKINVIKNLAADLRKTYRCAVGWYPGLGGTGSYSSSTPYFKQPNGTSAKWFPPIAYTVARLKRAGLYDALDFVACGQYPSTPAWDSTVFLEQYLHHVEPLGKPVIWYTSPQCQPYDQATSLYVTPDAWKAELARLQKYHDAGRIDGAVIFWGWDSKAENWVKGWTARDDQWMGAMVG